MLRKGQRRAGLLMTMALLAYFVPAARANTVMVYVHEAGQAYDDERTRDYLLGVEDGVLDTLFDTGVIAFSAGAVHNSAEFGAAPRYFAMNAAEQGGAQYLVDIGIHTTGSRNGTLSFSAGTLRVRTVPNGEVLREFALQPRENGIAAGERGFRSGLALGRDAGGGIVSLFQ